MAFSSKHLNTVIILIACVIVVAVVILRPAGETAAAVAPAEEETRYSVRSIPAPRETLTSYIQSSGEVEATRSIDVYPDMGGKLVRTNITLGSWVRRGDVIAEVDPSTPGVPYEISPVIAPLSGAVTSQPLQPGTTVSTGTAVAVIGSIDDLQITVHIPERYAALLQTGMQAEVTLDAYPGVIFPATVVRVSPVVDSVSRTKELQLTLNEKDSRVNAGMFAKVRLYTIRKENVVVVPETSILVAMGQEHVFVVSGDGRTAVQRGVTTGMRVDGMVEITAGLEEGEKVIIDGMHLLFDGSPIRDISSSVSGGNAV
ncbi:MAG: efflux RND transporter periplasmic adaptor subunit [Spirochaetes bacterium]|uniref:Efflux RND transporter periplasmic adaptor subunit n=1 Tax=Candidatus Avitreponema avistercoris TaxID=2840705 RepID=A0A9D9HHE7_9SPIR|nr:efflux RND transporter periplasmic adaptor subunit [Candidatus Avitreponema avistercoris]